MLTFLIVNIFRHLLFRILVVLKTRYLSKLQLIQLFFHMDFVMITNVLQTVRKYNLRDIMIFLNLFLRYIYQDQTFFIQSYMMVRMRLR